MGIGQLQKIIRAHLLFNKGLHILSPYKVSFHLGGPVRHLFVLKRRLFFVEIMIYVFLLIVLVFVNFLKHLVKFLVMWLCTGEAFVNFVLDFLLFLLAQVIFG